MRFFRLILLAFIASQFVCGELRAETPKTPAPIVSADPNDWPMYNYDIRGTRHNHGEKVLGVENVRHLELKWQFPRNDDVEKIGTVHATPVVVNGYVYFGTATKATFYKLTPNGKVKWSYKNPDYAGRTVGQTAMAPTTGFVNAPLVTKDTVFVGDAGGTIYALDRFDGKLHWKIDTRAKPFPDAHKANVIMSSPVLAKGKLLVAGGGFEHGLALDPKHRCCSGRGFVVALHPRSGKVLWKYDVGPKPQKFDPPLVINSANGKHVFHYGPSTSSVWCTPSYDAESQMIFFGTDTHNAPRRPTEDDARLYTKHSCAVIALNVNSGEEKWIRQITADDVWNYSIPHYDPKTGRYKDQSIGDTPKIYSIDYRGQKTKVIGFGSKNGGFFVLRSLTGQVLKHTPIYTGPPTHPPKNLNPRTLALPSAIGGLQTGCATDGRSVFTNGIDVLPDPTRGERPGRVPPTGGRITSISLDTQRENWRHERPQVKKIGGTREKPVVTEIGDPVGSGIALANGVAYFTTTVSNKLVALDTKTGSVLTEIHLGPVWCGPSISRGRVYVGSGNILFPWNNHYPSSPNGILYSFGLPGEDEISRLGEGNE